MHHNASVNALNLLGRTPLHLAAKIGSFFCLYNEYVCISMSMDDVNNCDVFMMFIGNVYFECNQSIYVRIYVCLLFVYGRLCMHVHMCNLE